MVSSNQPDRLSDLDDALLLVIISFLPFKDCVRTSVLSKRWEKLCHETKNIAFKYSEYRTDLRWGEARASFVRHMLHWVARFQGKVIDSFEISIYMPSEFLADIESLVEFAVSKKVKNIVLDFSHPCWRTFNDASMNDVVVQLPACVYNLKTLVSLKIYACEFDLSKFVYPRILKRLSIGCIRFNRDQHLIVQSFMLESLSFHYCWGLDFMNISGKIREFCFHNCDFILMTCCFDLPNVEIFKYSGDIICLEFDRMNKIIKQVFLDFTVEGGYDEPNHSTNAEGGILCGYLNNLRAARTLTVCPYLLQATPEATHPHMLHPVETQHLVLRTRMHPKEFEGIRLLLNNCPDLETLTFDILPPSPFMTSLTYRGIDPGTYWLQNITYKCFRKTLKVVVVKNFGGGSNELNLLRYLIRSGRGHGSGREVGAGLERIDLYLENRLEKGLMMVALAGADILQRTSKRVQVLVHNP